MPPKAKPESAAVSADEKNALNAADKAKMAEAKEVKTYQTAIKKAADAANFALTETRFKADIAAALAMVTNIAAHRNIVLLPSGDGMGWKSSCHFTVA